MDRKLFLQKLFEQPIRFFRLFQNKGVRCIFDFRPLGIVNILMIFFTTKMAVTDWENNAAGSKASIEKKLKPTVVMSDAVSGFSDPDFWGPYNVIEPEESIESGINKIQRKLERNKS